jgi:molybdopterin synthase catalytic subunit/molybdopterin converting factor small subunit
MSDHARVLFFATLRDRTGVREITIDFLQGSQISDIKKIVLENYPAIGPIMDTMIVALNHQFAFDEDIVPNEAEIAMFPPVSGGKIGGGKHLSSIAIVDHEIDINKIVAEITLPTTGGICVFLGIVREVTNRGVERQTEHLEYDAYQGMAESKLRQICEEIRWRWQDVDGIALVQRIGKLLPGKVSVIVACSSSHRDSGIFEAARYGIDRLKEIVPVWKKEVGQDGEEWIEGDYYPQRGE